METCRISEASIYIETYKRGKRYFPQQGAGILPSIIKNTQIVNTLVIAPAAVGQQQLVKKSLRESATVLNLLQAISITGVKPLQKEMIVMTASYKQAGVGTTMPVRLFFINTMTRKAGMEISNQIISHR